MKQALIIIFLALTICNVSAYEFAVSTNGDDNNPGSRDEPFATLARAREAVREYPRRGKEPVTITVGGGTYYLDEPLVFTAADSGSKDAPVTYQARANEPVIISGGMKRTVLMPQESRIKPLWNARWRTASHSSLAGSFVLRSVTSSMPIISPLPRTSPMT